MTTESKFLIPMHLQLFAGEDDLVDFNEDDLTDEDYDDDGEQHGPEYGDEDDAEPEQDPEPEPEQEPEPQPEPESEPQKRVQTPEENARFAEQRRQKQVQAEIDRLKQESPEFQLAQQLADMYGTTPDAMLEQVRHAALLKQSQQTGVPVEFLQQQQHQAQTISYLEEQMNLMAFEGWQRRIEAESAALKQEFPMLTDSDLLDAQTHLLQVMGNADAPLEQAVYALHGKKIASVIREQAKQEALAEISGRKGGPASVKGSKQDLASGLSSEERYVAKMMGISETEYQKHKLS